MSDIKFSCPQCGQHISCGEGWGGHSLECPACHKPIVVPQVQAPAAVPVSAASAAVSSRPAMPKLAAGVTQVARSTAPPPSAARKFTPRPPRGQNPLLRYGVMIVVVAALAGVGYVYVVPLVTNALQQQSNSQSPAGAKGSQGGGAGGGPLGEVNGAMDVSETLDSGSSPSRRPAVANTNTARPQPAAPRH